MMPNTLSKIVHTKVFTFILQMSILVLLIYVLNYNFRIDYDEGILMERMLIIQYLANLVSFKDIDGLIIILFSWILIGVFPVFLFNHYKKILSMNLLTFFMPNFFFYVFLNKYSRNYFINNFPVLFLNTVLVSVILSISSVMLGLVRMELSKSKSKDQSENLKKVSEKNKTVCPECGAKFESIPQFCYNCSKKLDSLNPSQEKMMR